MDLKDIFEKIDKLAKKNKTPIYAVGGFVRDLLLEKKEFKDVDFVVEGSGIKFAHQFDEFLKKQAIRIEGEYPIIEFDNQESKDLLEEAKRKVEEEIEK